MTAEQAFDDHHQAVYRFVYRLVGRADLAEDITQDCFLAFLRDPQRWDAARADIKTYLFSIARNLAFKRYRDDHTGLQVDEHHAVAIADQRMDQELPVLVAQMVSQLPDLQREALILFEYEGFQLNEIATIVNAEVGVVKSRLHRARGRFQDSRQRFNHRSRFYLERSFYLSARRHSIGKSRTRVMGQSVSRHRQANPRQQPASLAHSHRRCSRFIQRRSQRKAACPCVLARHSEELLRR